MTSFELSYLCLRPFLPPLHRKVSRRLSRLARSNGRQADVLDVGGRKSHYTIGIPARITITDLPRETEIQKRLNLGISDSIIEQGYVRRSNVNKMLFDDMTRSSLPDSSFDYVVAVEVLEHVEQDEQFVKEVSRVLKPGGIFLMTTPNGDSVKNTNPDHKRHYTRGQLASLLETHFSSVEVEYAIRGGTFRTLGLRSWSLKRPVRTALSMIGNVINTIQSARESLKHQPHGTRHLIATARKGKKAR